MTATRPTEALALLKTLAGARPDTPTTRLDTAQTQRLASLKHEAALCRQRRDFATAARLLREASALDPDDAETKFLLATALYMAGEPAEALEPMRAAHALSPRNVAVLANLGRILLDLNQDAEAEAMLRRGLDLDPGETPILRSLATLMRDSGRDVEARQFWSRLLAIRPDDAEARYNLARESDYRPDDAEIRETEAVLERTGGPTERAMLGFCLFRAHEVRAEPAEAFHWLEQCNRAIRSGFTYDAAIEERAFEQMRCVFDESFFATSPDDDAEAPIFIVGMPRSGTSLAEQILASHPLVFGAGERNTLTSLVGATLADPRRPGLRLDAFGFGSPQATEMRGRYLAELKAAAGDRPRFTDKMPLNFRWVGIIKTLFPKARIVHCTRPPIETCMSIYASIFGGGGNRFAYDLGELGHYYVAYARLMAHWHAVLGENDFMRLDLETLKDDQEAETRRLLAFCGLEWDPRCLAFEKTERTVKTLSAGQVHQGLDRSRDRRTAMFRPFLKPLEDILVAGGIDPDGEWG